jgi:tight adherence protein B
VTGALLAAAVALLVWPDRRPPPRRLDPVGSGAGHRWLAGAQRPSPFVVGCAGAALGAVVSTPLVAVLAGGCAALACRAVRAARGRTRSEAVLLVLAEALGVLVAELTAGRPLAPAVATAVTACPDERTARVLAAVLQPDGGTAGAGVAAPDDTALVPVLDRLRAAVRLSGRTGCSLTGVLAAVAEDLRARQRRALELRSATAGPRAAALLLAGLPVLGLVMGAGVGARPWTVLTTTTPGQVLLVSGVLLEVAGVAWVDRLIRRAASVRQERRP